MTLRELSQLYYLKCEIEVNERRLAELETYIWPGGNSDGVHGAGVSDSTGRIAAEIADLKAIISAKIEQCIHERSRLERYISTIDDSLTRQVFTLRFVDGLKWIQVALAVGGGNTEDGVKKLCYRYLKHNKTCPECPDTL